MVLSNRMFHAVILTTILFHKSLRFDHSQALATVNPVWPSGSYALPMANTGCPEEEEFTWITGHRVEELENDLNKNKHSASFHLKTNVGNPDTTRFFCVKNSTETDEGRPKWPDGKYCIYKKGLFCPQGFHAGYIKMDDNNGEKGSNRNSYIGELPEGVYDRDTMIYYCCKSTGSVKKRIALPVKKPFYLMPFESATCQEVKGVVYSLEYVVFDTENTQNQDTKVFPYPYGAHLENPTIHYCYYTECKVHFTVPVGMFSSPYFPQNYHDFHECQWNITVHPDHAIRLQFDVFELESNPYTCGHAKCSCDYVEIKEVSFTGEVISMGRYCMAKAPPSVLLSSTNQMMVTFHSDHTISAKGFNASYTSVLGKKAKDVTNKSTREGNSSSSIKPTTRTRGTVQESLINGITPNRHTSTTKRPGGPSAALAPKEMAPVNHTNHSSAIKKLTAQQIMGLSPKYFIAVIGSFVVVVSCATFLAWKLSKRNCKSSGQRREPLKLEKNNSERIFNLSSLSSSSLSSYREIEGSLLQDKLIDNPLYHKRNEQINHVEKHGSMEPSPLCCEESDKMADKLTENPLYERAAVSPPTMPGIYT
ncbi:uncharacterized protein LOC141896934 isoform X1 [Acropora palmata]|uniref:uncharacterized protein LOC141896934 isoform X1 n=1 Tax=Acropora palmata TaxID=6131 RepID=UPI003DA10121